MNNDAKHLKHPLSRIFKPTFTLKYDDFDIESLRLLIHHLIFEFFECYKIE